MRIIVAVAGVIAGVFVGLLHRHAQQPPPTQTNTPAMTEKARAPFQPMAAHAEEDYPEDLRLAPQEIFYFLQQHPTATLKRLWQRLGITAAQFDSDACDCEVNLFQYNLDDEVDSHNVLQIKRALTQSYRYLIFKGPDIAPKFLGHIDVYAKYFPSDPVVFLSNGRAWLVIQETAGTGSGLAAWSDTVYEVAKDRVRPVASYLARVHESGIGTERTKEFVGRPLSCRIQNGHAVLTVAYTLEYTRNSHPRVPFFTSRKTAVFIGSLKDGSTTLDAARSEISPRELETIYNFN